MASEERNALAELAERMFEEVDGKVLTNPNREDYDKARRIVAELAKVEYFECLDGVIRADEVEINAAFRKCRAIAEE